MQTVTLAAQGWQARKRRRELISKGLSYLFTTVLALLFAVPFIYLLSMSLQCIEQIVRFPPEWIPRPVCWQNYPNGLTHPSRPFLLYIKNTLVYSATATLGVTLSSAFVAFGFSRVEWPHRDSIFLLVLATMMLPYQVTLIPQFMIFWKFGWLDSIKPLVIPLWFGSAFDIFLLRQFFKTLPRELDEAAILDGCNYLQIWWRLILPLSRPALVTVISFSIVRTWNEFMGPLIYIQSRDKMTVSLGLRLFAGTPLGQQVGNPTGVIEFGQVMAMSVVSMLPVLILFIAAQRYFVTGIAMTGLREG